MKQRILSLLLVVAMLAAMIVVPAYAAGTCACGVEGCTAEWQPIDLSSATSILKDGHYYLEEDYIGSQRTIGSSSHNTEELSYDVVIDLRGHTILSTGRCFYVYNYSSLTLVDTVGGARLYGGYSTGSGGVFWVSPNATLNLRNDINVTATNMAKNMGVIGIDRGTFNMYGGTLNGSLNYNDKYVNTFNVSACGGNVVVRGGTFNMYGGTVKGGSSQWDGGNIYAFDYKNEEAKVNIYGGTIKGGSAKRNGGNICASHLNIDPQTTVLIEDGAVGGVGGNIYIEAHADADFGAPELTVKGGTIGGDIAFGAADAVVTLSGAPNIGLGHMNGLDLDCGETTIAVVASGLTGGEIFVDASGAFTTTAVSADYFKGAVRTSVTANAETGVLEGTQGTTGYCPHCYATTNAVAEWTALALPSGTGDYYTDLTVSTSAHYYLTQDATNTRRVLEVTADNVTVDLNGKTLTSTGSYAAVRMNTGYNNLSILDSVGNGAIVGSNGSTGTNGGALFVKGSANLYSGTIKNVTASTKKAGNGGTVWTNGDFHMYGGVIDGSGSIVTTSSIKGLGAAVYATSSTDNTEMVITIDNGIVVGGKAYYGGSVYMTRNTSGQTVTLNMNGGVVTDGTAVVGTSACCGGNIFVGSSATLNMTGGIVSSGEARRGGNLYAGGISATIRITGGLVTNGSATQYAGNVHAGNGYFTIASGVVYGGIAETYAGNIYTTTGNYSDTSDNFTVIGDDDPTTPAPVVYGGTAKTYGGTLWMRGVVTIMDCVLGGGSAGTVGNDIYMNYSAPTTESDGTEKINTKQVRLTIDPGFTGDIELGADAYWFADPAVYGSVIKNTSCTELNGKIWLDGYDLPPVKSNGTNLFVEGQTAVVDADGNYAWYTSNADAVTAYGGTGYIKLYTDAELALNGNATVDLNGHSVTISGTGAVTGMDSENDTYKAANCGTATLSGVTLATNCYEIDGGWYIAVAGETEGTYTFHRLEMAITSVSIRPSAAGVYYWAQWDCDSTLAGLVDTYGIATSLTQLKEGFDITGTLYTELTKANFTACEEQTGALMTGMVMVPDERTADYTGYNSLNDMYGKTQIYAVPYIWLSVDGTSIKLDGVDSQVSYSLHDLVQMVDAAVTGYTDDVYFTAMDTFATTWADANLGWTYTNYQTQLAAKEAAEAESTT